MTAKTIVTGGLLLFVAVSLGALGWKSARSGDGTAGGSAGTPPAAAAGEAGQAEATVPHKLVVYYLHGNKRCNTCRAIEAQSREALEAGFPEALMTGRVEFRDVNFDEPANERFLAEFELSGSSLVVAEFRNGARTRFKNLQKVWDLFADKPAFLSYVQDETRSWLEAP